MADLLFDSGSHKNIFFEDFTEGEMIPANVHLIVHNNTGLLLDPGGHKVYPKIMAAMPDYLPLANLKHIFLSHQDPDIVASVNGWLMTTDADAYISKIWKRFVAHFGVAGPNLDRMLEMPDEGMRLDMGGCELLFLPAHFLHSSGNFHLYDPISKILYSGDLGASVVPERTVQDFDAHIANMIGFHQRYMGNNIAGRLWAKMVRQLDIEIIAPQHGAIFEGKDMVNQFIDWIEVLPVGPELMEDVFQIPS